MRRWKTVLVSTLFLFAVFGSIITLAACVSDDAHAANVAQASAQEAKLEALHTIYESRIAEMSAKLQTLQADSEEAGTLREELGTARVKLAEYTVPETEPVNVVVSVTGDAGASIDLTDITGTGGITGVVSFIPTTITNSW